MHCAIGVFAPNDTLSNINGYADWLGRQPTHVVVNGDWSQDWAKVISSLQNQAVQFAPGAFNCTFGIPAFPVWDDATGAHTMARAAAGDYDAHYRNMARQIRDNGFPNALIRPMWELNGSWMPWYAGNTPALQSQAIGVFQRIVDNMRVQTTGTNYKVVWSTTMGLKSSCPQANIYPGDAFVDYLDYDVYDEWWNAGNDVDIVRRWRDEYMGTGSDYRLNWIKTFATVHNKKISFSEWGLRPVDHVVSGGVNHGGGDNPYFVEQLLRWANDNAHMIAYFEKGAPGHRLMDSQGSTLFPNGRAKFREILALP